MKVPRTLSMWLGRAMMVAALAGCASKTGQTGSETNWLPCDTTTDCDGNGVCTGGQCIPNNLAPTACTWSSIGSSKDARDRIEQTKLLPPSARLESVRSDVNGAMRVDGRSFWHFIYWDASGQLLHDFNVCGAGIFYKTRPGPYDCDANELEALDSATVVPDAVSRIPDYAGKDVQDHFLIQQRPCFNPQGTIELDYVTVLLADRVNSGPDVDEWWFVHYEGGTFQKMCGPCATNNVAECTTCGAP